MGKVERIDRVLSLQARHFYAPFDGTASSRLQFQIGQTLQCGSEAQVIGGGISDRLIQMAAHRRQAELFQFLGECVHRSRSFRGEEERRIPTATEDRSPVDPVPGY